MQLPSLVELHAAITHFPIVLLIVSALFEFGVLLWRNDESRRMVCRQSSLVILILAVVAAIPALLTGYLTVRDMPMPPVGFDLHWQAAIVTSSLAVAVLAGRLATRDHLTVTARTTLLTVLLCAVGAVAYTGHSGGKMVFGGRSAQRVAVKPKITKPETVEPSSKLEAASRNMEAAANKLDLAADRLARAAGAQPSNGFTPSSHPGAGAASTGQSTVTTVAQPPIASGVPSPAPSAARLDRAAARSGRTAEKLGRIADHIAAATSPPEIAALPQITAAPANGGRPNASGTAASAPTVNAPTPAAQPGVPDALLIAVGAKVYADPKLGCVGCHKLNGKGGDTGPDLTGIGNDEYDIDWHMRHIRNPQAVVDGSGMPPYPASRLSDADLRAIATYLTSLK